MDVEVKKQAKKPSCQMMKSKSSSKKAKTVISKQETSS